MSTIIVEVVEVISVVPHPNADRLDIAQILGTQCVIAKGSMNAGDKAFWFPPNILIPDPVATELGVVGYLKHCIYPGDNVRTQCRVAATKLRGTPSYGFLIPLGNVNDGLAIGEDASSRFDAVKYEPPTEWGGTCGRVHKGPGPDAAPDHWAFHKYTDIENYYKYGKALDEGTPVRMTEKIHGMNCRLGLIYTDIGWQFMCGTRRVNWNPITVKESVPLVWQMLTEEIMGLLSEVCDEQWNCILFGEIYGLGIQDMDYGCSEPTFCAFDLSINGAYQDFEPLRELCTQFDVPMVPLMYEGPFSKEILDAHTFGETALASSAEIKSAYKGREGVVVTPLTETFSPLLGGRLVLKSVSADYLDRKGATDN